MARHVLQRDRLGRLNHKYAQVALTDLFDPTNLYVTSSWLASTNGYHVPNNHYGEHGENVTMMDGHTEWRMDTMTTHKYNWASVYW